MSVFRFLLTLAFPIILFGGLFSFSVELVSAQSCGGTVTSVTTSFENLYPVDCQSTDQGGNVGLPACNEGGSVGSTVTNATDIANGTCIIGPFPGAGAIEGQDGGLCSYQIVSISANTCAPPPTNCVGQWEDVGSCSATCGGGTIMERYRVTTPAANNGAQCPHADGATRNTKSCNTQPCVTCTPTWSPAPSTQCSGVSFTQTNSCDGSTRSSVGTKTDGICAPPAPVNCQGSWSGGSCSATCGGGTRTETYTITQPRVGTGLACEAANGATRSAPCNTQSCPAAPVDCQVSAWSSWGSCSTNCGGGTQTRTRTVITQQANGGAACPALSEERACNTQTCTLPPVDCQVSAWSSWGQCSQACGGGTQTRTRSITTQPANNGASCPALSENQACNTQACPQCTPSWVPAPSTQCSGVSFTQTNQCNTSTQTANGTKTDGICAPAPTPVNCQGSWGGWGECVGGQQSRSYNVTTPAQGTGTACPASPETRSCTAPPACVPGWFPTDDPANYCTYESVWVNDGCGGGFVTPGTRNCATPPALVVDLKVNNRDGQATVLLGQDFTLSWQTENGTCQLFGDGISRSNRPNASVPGSLTLPVSAVGTQPGDSETYLLSCNHSLTGQVSQDSVLVVIGASNPNLMFSAARATASPLNPTTGTYDRVTVEFIARNDSNTAITQSSQYRVQTRAGNRTGTLDPIPAQRDHSLQTITFTNVSPGPFSVTVTLDSQGAITETNENDNESTFDATIPPLNPGLGLTVTPERVQNGKSATVRWTAATPYAMNCSLFGPAMTTRNFNLTSPSFADNNITVGPLTAKSEYTLRCDAAGVIFTATDIVETQGVIEEI